MPRAVPGGDLIGGALGLPFHLRGLRVGISARSTKADLTRWRLAVNNQARCAQGTYLSNTSARGSVHSLYSIVLFSLIVRSLCSPAAFLAALRRAMARQKQKSPLQREPSGFNGEKPMSSGNDWKASNGNGVAKSPRLANGSIKDAIALPTTEQAGLPQLIVCVGGIYMSLYLTLDLASLFCITS